MFKLVLQSPHMPKLLTFLLLLVFLLIAGLTYAGLMPVLSPALLKPKDLGVRIDPQLVADFDVSHQMINALPDGKVPADREPNYSGQISLDVTLDSAEISSILDYWQQQYSKTPISQVQVRINDDGSGEVSGILDLAVAVEMAKQLGYSDEQIEQGKRFLGIINTRLPFYLQGTGSVTDNRVSIQATQAKIANINLPSEWVTQVNQAAGDAIERRIRQIPNLEVESLRLVDGAVSLKATAPNTIE